jgi:hypothetical protein
MSVPKRSALLILVAVAGAALTVITPTPAAALCIPPVDVTSATVEATVAHRYAWFLIESLSRARLAWEEADRGAESHNAVVRLSEPQARDRRPRVCGVPCPDLSGHSARV